MEIVNETDQFVYQAEWTEEVQSNYCYDRQIL